jgi:hypothetical protein
MKVTLKHIHTKNDCFEAEERGNEIRIGRFRHIVEVTITQGETKYHGELSIADLASYLIKHPNIHPSYTIPPR